MIKPQKLHPGDKVAIKAPITTPVGTGNVSLALRSRKTPARRDL